MTAPWPDPSHVCAGSGEPILDTFTHRAIRDHPGATADEIVEEVFALAYWGPMTAYDRRTTSDQIREIVAETWTPRPTRDEIKAKQAELEKQGRPSGQRPVAEALHTSKSYVQRVLAGEDQPER